MCQFVPAGRWLLPPEPASAGKARRLCRDRMYLQHDDARAETALLLVSELVTNAVLHGAPPILMHLTCDDQHVLQVRVSDANPKRPTPETTTPQNEHGRGLAITALLSDAWGIDPTSDGKTVWFRLQTTHGPPGHEPPDNGHQAADDRHLSMSRVDPLR